ncbi:hypothetical protein DL771_006573 [Monosporascus sp. 5C6A]|nr:hypothetical protein DL771_006573 [Monosporascus sp. 5C6A]
MSRPEATSSPTQHSGPPGHAPKDDTQTYIDNPNRHNEDESSDNARNMEVTSEGKDPKPDRSHSAPEQEGRQSPKGDSKNNIVSPGAVKLSRKISRVANILEQEIEDLLDKHEADLPLNLENQIEILRKLGKELNKKEKSEGTASPVIQESSGVSGDAPDQERSPGAQHPVTFNQPPATNDAQNKDDIKREKEVSTRVAHLQLLYDFIETELKYYLELRVKVENGSLTTIAFDELWYLFRPGDVLYDECQGYEQALKIYSVTGGQPRRRNHTKEEKEVALIKRQQIIRNTRPRRYSDDSDEADSENENTNKDALVEASGLGTWSPFTIDCYKMGFDGLRVGPLDSCRQIKHYSGECKITDLPIYPLRFHERKHEIAANLEARGRDFLNSYGHKSYNGFTVPRTRRAYQEELRGDVFIDLKNFYRTRPRQRPKLGILRKSRPDQTEVEESVATDAGRWRQLLDHEVDEKITDDYMASSHTFAEPIDFELVQESAEHLQLLPYEIPAFVFRTRSYCYVDISKLAEIDKSDEARDTGFDDLVIPEGHRDLLIALVQNHATGGKVEVDLDGLNKASTQIEILEYYSGILFLTTNRVGVIDEAFKSRIHISLRYPRIQQRETRQIWENILKRIERNNEASGVKIKFDRASLLEFADKHYRKNEEMDTTWNGRQIRNAFQTAIALGHYEREKRLKAAGMTEEDAARSGQKTWMTVKLTRANFRNIAKTASEFEDYLASVRGPDSSLAKENHLRDDAHDPDTPVVRKDYGSGVTSRGKLGLLSPPPTAALPSIFSSNAHPFTHNHAILPHHQGRRSRSSGHPGADTNTGPALAAPADAGAAAGEEGDDNANKGAGGGGDEGPGGAAVHGVGVVISVSSVPVVGGADGVVDLVAHDGKGHEVADERHNGHEEGHERHERHEVGQRAQGGGGVVGKVDPVEVDVLADDGGGIVADYGPAAPLARIVHTH